MARRFPMIVAIGWRSSGNACFQRLGECIDPFRQIERKIIEKVTVDGAVLPHPLRRHRYP